jgi:hypothetical protein
MRKTLILLPLLGLAACASPQQTCIGGVSRDLAVVNQLITQTELNIVRGYGTESRQEVRTIPRTCRDYRPVGTYEVDICDTTVVQNVSVPIALDLDAERAKLRQLQQQRDRLEAPTQTAIQQCIATYPE